MLGECKKDLVLRLLLSSSMMSSEVAWPLLTWILHTHIRGNLTSQRMLFLSEIFHCTIKNIKLAAGPVVINLTIKNLKFILASIINCRKGKETRLNEVLVKK